MTKNHFWRRAVPNEGGIPTDDITTQVEQDDRVVISLEAENMDIERRRVMYVADRFRIAEYRRAA